MPPAGRSGVPVMKVTVTVVSPVWSHVTGTVMSTVPSPSAAFTPAGLTSSVFAPLVHTTAGTGSAVFAGSSPAATIAELGINWVSVSAGTVRSTAAEPARTGWPGSKSPRTSMTWAAASGLTRVRARACVVSAAPAMASGPGTVRSPPPDVLAGAVRDVLPAWLPADGLTTRCHNAAHVHGILQRPPPEFRHVWMEQRRTYSRRGSRPKDRPRTVGLGVPVKE